VGSIDSSLGSQVTFGIAVIVSRGRAFAGTGEFRVGESAAAGRTPGARESRRIAFTERFRQPRSSSFPYSHGEAAATKLAIRAGARFALEKS